MGSIDHGVPSSSTWKQLCIAGLWNGVQQKTDDNRKRGQCYLWHEYNMTVAHGFK